MFLLQNVAFLQHFVLRMHSVFNLATTLHFRLIAGEKNGAATKQYA